MCGHQATLDMLVRLLVIRLLLVILLLVRLLLMLILTLMAMLLMLAQKQAPSLFPSPSLRLRQLVSANLFWHFCQ